MKNAPTEEYKHGEVISQNETHAHKTTNQTSEITKINQPATKPLYMDALNFGSIFFDISKTHWSILEAAEKIKRFVNSAINSGWELKVFIDAATQTEETVQKWKQRRETEVRDEIRNMPHGFSTLFGDAFRESGVEVNYSVEADNDDTLAAYASRDNAAILSGDRDFFRYRGLTCPILGKFEITNNQLHLFELVPNQKTVSKRDIISPPPEVMKRDPAIVELSKNMYRRGAPSPLVKRMGNIHVACRPLRQALYARKGVKGSVFEVFPIWQDNKVVWSEEHVLPDDKLDNLLDDPSKALETLFPKLDTLVKPDEVSSKNWENHLYAIRAVVYELCALGSKNGISFLQMLTPTLVKFKESGKQFISKPAYESSCKGCKVSIKLNEQQVSFFKSKGFDMPKWCKECKQKKNAGRNNK